MRSLSEFFFFFFPEIQKRDHLMLEDGASRKFVVESVFLRVRTELPVSSFFLLIVQHPGQEGS